MTIDTWLIIATIISAMMLAAATLFAPSLAEVVKVFVNQPKATPVTSQPKQLTGDMVIAGKKIRRWVLLASILYGLGIYAFGVYRIHANNKIDSYSVLFMAAGITTPAYTLALSIIGRVVDFVNLRLREQGDVNSVLLQNQRVLISALRDSLPDNKTLLDGLKPVSDSIDAISEKFVDED